MVMGSCCRGRHESYSGETDPPTVQRRPEFRDVWRLTQQALADDSVAELEAAIHHYIARRNVDPRPFTWTASVKTILAKVRKANETLASLH
jgi:hypothetical protein